MDIIGLIIFFIAVVMTAAGAYVIANAICQRNWKEKVSQIRLSGFICVFIFSFTLLGMMMCMAMAMTFGR